MSYQPSAGGSGCFGASPYAPAGGYSGRYEQPPYTVAAPPPGYPTSYQTTGTANQPPSQHSQYQPSASAPSVPPSAPPAAPASAPMPSTNAAVDPTLQTWFNSIDVDRNGHLDAAELQKALALGNLNFGLTDVDQMIRAFSIRGERRLDVQEFAALHNFLTSVTHSFQYFDVNKTKSLGLPEVSQALANAGFRLDPPVMAAMVLKYDPSNNNAIELDEYIRMCLFLQSCVRTYGAFDSQRRGRIELDFNQFVYACSHIC